eukprot:UN21636
MISMKIWICKPILVALTCTNCLKYLYTHIDIYVDIDIYMRSYRYLYRFPWKFGYVKQF